MSFIDGEKNLYEIKHVKGDEYTISDFEFSILKEKDIIVLKTSEEFLQEVCSKVNEKKLKDLNQLFESLTLEYEKEVTFDIKEDSPLYKNQDVFEEDNDNNDIKFVDRIRWNNEDFNMDIFLYVFEYLPIENLFKLNRVSKEWKKLAEDEKLWEGICKRHNREKSDKTWRNSCMLYPLPIEGKKGILYYIGTKGFTTEECNPIGNGVRPFSDYNSVCNLNNFVSLVPGVCQISDSGNFDHYLAFDFSSTKYKLLPEHYWIQHRNEFDDTALRNWVLEASNDGHNWDLLSKHEKDESLQPIKKSEASWKISPTPTKLYSMFRIRQTGTSSGNYQYLNLGQIEIYGKLKKK